MGVSLGRACEGADILQALAIAWDHQPPTRSHRCPLWVKSRHVQRTGPCPLCAINVRFASRRTAAKFASLFDEAGGGVRDMTEIDRTGEHA